MDSGVSMLKGYVRLAALAVSGASLLALTGCGAARDDLSSAPPPYAYEDHGPRPELAGAPQYAGAADDGLGLAGGPARDASAVASAPLPPPSNLDSYRRQDGTLVLAMKPVPNPEDMSPAERHRVYGARYAPRAATVTPRSRRRPAPVAAAPAPKPVVKATAPVPVVKTPPPAAKPAPAPVAAAKPVPVDKFGALQAAIQAEATRGSTLSVPDTLAEGQPAEVSLTLPQTLLDTIQREAARFGFARPARKAEVTATLSGQGYEITPNGPQTARLKPGEAAKFDWQVRPSEGAKAPLKAEATAALKGQGAARTFPLVTLEQAVQPPAPPPAPAEAGKGFSLPKFALPGLPGLPSLKGFDLSKLAIPGVKDVDLPVVGKTPSQHLVLGAAAALLLLILALASRAAGERRRRAERRRKFRTMSALGSEPEPEVERHDNTVSPALAAAGGAALGAAATHFAHEAHDDHVPAAPVHEAHDDHGHAPAHDDHHEPEHA